MKNKRGQVFGLYLVFITVFFCLLGVYFYFQNQSYLYTDIVSSKDVLKLNDDFDVFEKIENVSIKTLYCDLGKKGLIDADLIEEGFCLSVFIKNDFLFKNGFKFKNKVFLSDELGSSVARADLCKALYDFSVSNGDLIVKRSEFSLVSKLGFEKDKTTGELGGTDIGVTVGNYEC